MRTGYMLNVPSTITSWCPSNYRLSSISWSINHLTKKRMSMIAHALVNHLITCYTLAKWHLVPLMSSKNNANTKRTTSHWSPDNTFLWILLPWDQLLIDHRSHLAPNSLMFACGCRRVMSCPRQFGTVPKIGVGASYRFSLTNFSCKNSWLRLWKTHWYHKTSYMGSCRSWK